MVYAILKIRFDLIDLMIPKWAITFGHTQGLQYITSILLSHVQQQQSEYLYSMYYNKPWQTY